MTTGIVLLNFGEPSEPDREAVVTYLRRLFTSTAIQAGTDPDAARERGERLAERRAPGLVEEYKAIDGSPLNEQLAAQADALEAELRARDFDVATYVGLQFTDPLVDDAVAAARADGVDRLVGLSGFPLCGPTTTVAALDDMADAVSAAEWDVTLACVAGWHRYPPYIRLRRRNLERFVAERGLNLDEPDTELVFAAHGVPQHFVASGSRYVTYVEESCKTIAGTLGIHDYTVGYQNHESGNTEWTNPDLEDALAAIDADRVLVEPVSFVHEQSETLFDLDREAREEATAAGLDFHRVPVPHDAKALPDAMADLLEPLVADFVPGYYGLRPCQCADSPGAVCLNAPD